MKKSKFFLLSLLTVMTFSACGSSDDLGFSGGNNGGNTGGSSTAYNTNKNVATDNMPQVVKNAIGGLEFPKIKGTDKNYVIVHMDGNDITYSTEWDDSKKSQRWSCYTFNTKNSQQNVSGRYNPPTGQRQYPYDTDLKALYGITDFTSDPYPTTAGFDHGHICPNADRFYSANQRFQTYYMTNMQPQYKNFNENGGTWYNMEIELRKLAPKINTDTLFVVKGGTIDDKNIIEYRKNGAVSSTQLAGYIPIPKFFFVAVLKKEYNKTTKAYNYYAFGYWFPHVNQTMGNNDKLSNYVVNIKTLEDKTGIDFFCNLPDDIEQKVENLSLESIKNIWGFK